jgi:hypothetical protein
MILSVQIVLMIHIIEIAIINQLLFEILIEFLFGYLYGRPIAFRITG